MSYKSCAVYCKLNQKKRHNLHTFMYVLKKQIGIKQNTHFGKIAFNQIDYKNKKSRVLHLAINWSLLVVNFIND